MILSPTIDNWLSGLFWHKSDTPETLEQKVYLVGNMVIPAILIGLDLILIYFLTPIQIFLLTTPLLISMIVTTTLLLIIKRGIKWFLYTYYGGFIILSCLISIKLGGLPQSCGVWGGAFICFVLAIGLRNKNLLIFNALIYSICLVILGFLSKSLTINPYLDPKINNLFYTVNEIWMCAYLVKSFYDSIILKIDEAKEKARQLQELDLLKSKRFANIAHEFRTPLAIIRGNAGEISEEVKGETANRATDIIRNSDRILYLVNQMLNLSRIEEGGVSLHYTQSDMVAFVRFMVNTFQGFADSKKINLHFWSECPQLVMDLEAEKLEEVLSNLLSNAIKYTPNGGEVYVTLRELKPTETDGRQVGISVRDTGIGIPEDQLNKIFIRFYRVEDDRYPFQDGTGIGLTLVNEYLKLMEGSIRVISEPDKGSEFIISLPVTHNADIVEAIPQQESFGFTAEASLIEPEEFRSGGCNPRLLIIEDNKELTAYLIRLLQKDYQILTAANGLRGIEMAVEHIPDIILSDVMMPGKDGYQVCKTLKNDFRTNHIPIALLTARADTHSRIIGIEHGADAYLAKPFDKKELTVCLSNLLVQRNILRLKYSADPFGKESEENGLNEKFLNRIITHLEKNYQNEKYGINHLYSDMGISRVQLHRKLTAITGQTTSNFIRNFRLQKARNLLLNTDKFVSDIAYESGFADANYFSKAFIHGFGMTASEFRKSFQ